MIARHVRSSVAILIAMAAAACAPKLAPLPTGPGAAFPEFAPAYQQAIERCRSIRTIASVLSISGRAAGQRFRANVDAGFEAPDKAMLELPAPGRPIFTFAATGGSSTLVLAREGRVLQNAPADETLEALAGIRLRPEELRAIVTGCGFGAGEPSNGRSFNTNRGAVDVAGGTAYLERPQGRWILVGATRGPLEVRYADFTGDLPGSIRLRTPSAEAGQRTDLTIRTSQVDIDQPIAPQAFTPEIPAGAKPLTLEQLRQAGPLGR